MKDDPSMERRHVRVATGSADTSVPVGPLLGFVGLLLLTTASSVLVWLAAFG